MIGKKYIMSEILSTVYMLVVMVILEVSSNGVVAFREVEEVKGKDKSIYLMMVKILYGRTIVMNLMILLKVQTIPLNYQS